MDSNTDPRYQLTPPSTDAAKDVLLCTMLLHADGMVFGCIHGISFPTEPPNYPGPNERVECVSPWSGWVLPARWFNAANEPPTPPIWIEQNPTLVRHQQIDASTLLPPDFTIGSCGNRYPLESFQHAMADRDGMRIHS
jgi:hypothetical protein